jgi:hypothetical protein
MEATVEHQWSGQRRLTKESAQAISATILSARSLGMREIVVEDKKADSTG